jgi:hypothetical protein
MDRRDFDLLGVVRFGFEVVDIVRFLECIQQV